MNINELKEQDPSRFDDEYQKWREYQCTGYDWWDAVEEGFKTDMALLGLEVDRIYFSLGYCQSDYASFEGTLSVTQWMKNEGYDVQYQALWLAMCDYGFGRKVENRYACPNIDWEYYYSVGGNTEPSGIFEGLDQDAWCELVESQMDAEPWECLINDWLQDKARDLYTQLVQEYEYLTSEEQFIESCENNDVEFDETEE